MVFGAYGGVLAERFERVRLMVILNLVCAALMGVLALITQAKGPGAAGPSCSLV
jgi:nitrate/nitrite transporter NarK